MLPLAPKTKVPLEGFTGWPSLHLSEKEIKALWSEQPSLNVALVCGHGLAVVDLDSPKAQAWYINTFGGLPATPTVRTARGYHLFFKAPPDASTWKAEEGVEDVDVKAAGGYVVAAPSYLSPKNVHPTVQHLYPNGFTYSWVKGPETPLLPLPERLYKPPESPRVKQKDGFNGHEGALEAPLASSQTAKQPLPPRVQAALELWSKDPKATPEGHRFESRSEVDLHLCHELRKAGRSRTEVEAHLASWPHAQEKTGRARAVYVGITASKAFNPSKSQKARALAEKVLYEARAKPLPGKGGLTATLVLQAHAKIALHCARLTYHTSLRRLAEAAGVSKDAVKRANTRLQKEGFLSPQKRNEKGSQGYTLQSGQNETVVFKDSPNCESYCRSKSTFWVGHDAFRRGGLPRSAGLVCDSLLSGSKGVKDLAKLTGRSPKTVKRALVRLQAVGMVKKTGRLYEAVPFTVERLDELAIELGTAGAKEKQRRRHEVERGDYLVYLLRLKAPPKLTYKRPSEAPTPPEGAFTYDVRKPLRGPENEREGGFVTRVESLAPV